MRGKCHIPCAPMASSNPFSRKLKELRGQVPVEQLAQQSGVAPASIYKAETTASVRWQTVEKAYSGFFRDAHDHCLTLILWALEQTDRKVALYEAAAEAKSLLREEVDEIGENAETLQRIIMNLSPPDTELLLSFAKRYCASEPTRDMVRAWMTAMGR